jgi:hypothetical protein
VKSFIETSMKIYFRSRKYQIEFWKKNQLLSQEFLFYDLLHKARNTEYGKEHSFDHIVDYAGFNTYDTMYRARNVFKVESAIVVTQSFHLPRAVVLASVFEIPVQGVPASPEPATWRNNVREIAARVKAVGDIVTARDPRYGGAEIPVSGDGRTTIGT